MAKRGGRSGRKYVRDSIGRFATTGATARGGRLKTKSGKKRATQTVKAKTGGKPAGAIKGKIKRDPGAAKPAAAKPAAAKTKLKRSGEKIGVGRLTTNKEQGRKGIVSMSSQAKAARKGAVAERKSEKMSRIAERQSGIVARRQVMRASNYNPDGTFNQSTANANQRRLGRSKQLQEKLRYAGGGKNIASKALSKRRKAKPAAAKPAAAKPTSARDAATARLKIKTATRRKLKADRSSVIPVNPKARRVQSARIGSTVAKKARAKGNAPATIANRVKRKAAVNKANLRENTRYGNVVDGKQYERQIKTSMTLDRAQNYLKTGQKGKPTEKARRALLAAKRAPEMAAARTRLNALNAKRAAKPKRRRS